MNRILKGLGIMLALIAVGAASAVVVISLLLRQEEVRVPDLTGRDIVTVIEVVGQQGLQLKVDRREPSQTIVRDAVVSQSPPPGTGVKKGRTVRVVLSEGPSELLVPKVAGEQYRKADVLLRQHGLTVHDVARAWSDTVERDMVMAQDPTAGSPFEKGGGVNLLVSLGKKSRLSITPAFVGKKAEDAVRTADRLGLQYRLISRASGSAPPAGDRTIAGQRPNPGYPLAADGVVELYVR